MNETESEPYRELNRQHRLCYVKLPGLYMCKVDGAPNADGKRRAVAAHVLNTGENAASVQLWDNGRNIATMTMECGFNVALKLAKSMCESLTRLREHSRRYRHNRKLRRDAANATPAEPTPDLVLGNPPFFTPEQIARGIESELESGSV